MNEKILKPCRVTRTYTQRLHAHPKEIFPLLCPVRELEWVSQWPLDVVYTNSGVAEHGCVFQTDMGDVKAIWVITKHDPYLKEVEMVRVTPGVTACILSIVLREKSEHETLADVTYTHTAIGPAGIQYVEEFTEDAYINMMQTWERELNAYLKEKVAAA